MLTREQMNGSIYEGDCLEIMRQFPDSSVDMVLCDLPYGTTRSKWDSVIDLEALWKQYRRIVKPSGAIVLTSQGLFTCQLGMSAPDMFRYKMVWEKCNTTNFLNAKKQPLRKYEDVCVFYRSQPTYNPQMGEGKPYSTQSYRNGKITACYGRHSSILTVSNGSRYPTDVLRFKNAQSETGGGRLASESETARIGEVSGAHVHESGRSGPGQFLRVRLVPRIGRLGGEGILRNRTEFGCRILPWNRDGLRGRGRETFEGDGSGGPRSSARSAGALRRSSAERNRMRRAMRPLRRSSNPFRTPLLLRHASDGTLHFQPYPASPSPVFTYLTDSIPCIHFILLPTIHGF